MTQENKELLLKDLSARLQYGVKIKVRSNDIRTVRMVDMVEGIVHFVESDSISLFGVHIEHPLTFRQVIKPYLRPMSSMTEEEFVYFMGLRGRNFSHHDIRQMMKEAFNMPNHIPIVTQLYCYLHKMDWLLSKHFDVRGLIERSLAIAVTEENNPYKE